MRLEYFQLIDRISSSTSAGRTIRARGDVPIAVARSSRGISPAYPLMPGVLLLETMAQTSGWLIIGLTGFTRMPFLAAFKEAKLRSFVTPGTALIAERDACSTKARATRSPRPRSGSTDKRVCNAEITFRAGRFPEPAIPRQACRRSRPPSRSRWRRLANA